MLSARGSTAAEVDRLFVGHFDLFAHPGVLVDRAQLGMSHATMGLDARVSAAETARIQGVDLYGEQQVRLVAGYALNVRWFAEFLVCGSAPSWLCNGSLSTGGVNYTLAWEVGYNALASRRGVPMPYTWAFIQTVSRPSNYQADLFMDWQTPTHAGQ